MQLSFWSTATNSTALGGDAKPSIKFRKNNNETNPWTLSFQGHDDLTYTFVDNSTNTGGTYEYHFTFTIRDWNHVLNTEASKRNDEQPVSRTELFNIDLDVSGDAEESSNYTIERSLIFPKESYFITIQSGNSNNLVNPSETDAWINYDDRTVWNTSTSDCCPNGTIVENSCPTGDPSVKGEWGRNEKTLIIMNLGGVGSGSIGFTWTGTDHVRTADDQEYDGNIPNHWAQAGALPDESNIKFNEANTSLLIIDPDAGNLGGNLKSGGHKRVITFTGFVGGDADRQFVCYMHVPSSRVQFAS